MPNDYYNPSGWPASSGKVLLTKTGFKAEFALVSAGFDLVAANINGMTTSAYIISTLGYTPLDKAGGTMTGPLTVPSCTVTGEVSATGKVKATFASLHASGWGADSGAGMVHFGDDGSYIFKTTDIFVLRHGGKDFAAFVTKGGVVAMVADVVTIAQGFNSVGSVAYLKPASGSAFVAGASYSGALLTQVRWSGSTYVDVGVMSGTWLCLGISQAAPLMGLFKKQAA